MQHATTAASSEKTDGPAPETPEERGFRLGLAVAAALRETDTPG